MPKLSIRVVTVDIKLMEESVMTKLEQQVFENMKIQCALRFTEKVYPDILPPENFDKIVNGYSFNSYSEKVEKSCSSRLAHSLYAWNKTNSRESIEQYSSRLLALKAMRYEMEQIFAKKLYAVDVLIEKEKCPTNQ